VEENLSKTIIIVDGMNVAIRHGHDKRFSSKGLKITIDYWTSRKHNVMILLPDFCFNKEEAIKKQS
jgi:ribonuclease ZC3H12